MVPEPALPDSVTPADLDTDVRRDLRGLQKETAEKVARHLVAAGLLVDEEPERALLHVRYARRRASRIAVVREAAGIVAYHAGEWNEALGEFRAARRMGGGPGHVPVMADIERALGRPERALELTRGPEVRDLGEDERIELLIVAAGARRDLGELDAAVVGLQVAELEPSRRDPWSGRLFYAYADNLLAAGRRAEAVQWFVHAHDADTEDETDAATRIADLTGDELPGAGDEGLTIGMEDVPTPPPVEVVDEAPAADVVGESAVDTEIDAVTAEPAETVDPRGGARVDGDPGSATDEGGEALEDVDPGDLGARDTAAAEVAVEDVVDARDSGVVGRTGQGGSDAPVEDDESGAHDGPDVIGDESGTGVSAGAEGDSGPVADEDSGSAAATGDARAADVADVQAGGLPADGATTEDDAVTEDDGAEQARPVTTEERDGR